MIRGIEIGEQVVERGEISTLAASLRLHRSDRFGVRYFLGQDLGDLIGCPVDQGQQDARAAGERAARFPAPHGVAAEAIAGRKFSLAQSNSFADSFRINGGRHAPNIAMRKLRGNGYRRSRGLQSRVAYHTWRERRLADGFATAPPRTAPQDEVIARALGLGRLTLSESES